MKKTKKPGKKIEKQLLLDLVGEEGISIIDFIRDKENTSEFIISEKLNIEIHRTRTLLYTLLKFNIATFIRKKDREKGWYICYWNYHPTQIIHTLKKLKQEKLDKLKERLDKEQANQFFMCKSACVRKDFEKAMDDEFKCPECGELMNQQDNSRTIEFLKEKINLLQEEIDKIGG